MSWTKGELASGALEEIGIASYEFDITPEMRQSIIRRMDTMMAIWAKKDILLSYPVTKSPTPDPDQETNIPDWAGEAVITNLAIRITTSYGKAVSPETKVTAKTSYSDICGVFAQPKGMQFPSMPKGAGYKTTEYRYLPAPKDRYLEDVEEEFDPSGGPE